VAPLPDHGPHLLQKYTTERQILVKGGLQGLDFPKEGDAQPAASKVKQEVLSFEEPPGWLEVEVDPGSNCHHHFALRGERSAKLHVPGKASGKGKAELDPTDAGEDRLGLPVRREGE